MALGSSLALKQCQDAAGFARRVAAHRALRIGETPDLVSADRAGEAFDVQVVHRLSLDLALEGGERTLAKKDLPRRRLVAQARREARHAAERAVVVAPLEAYSADPEALNARRTSATASCRLRRSATSRQLGDQGIVGGDVRH
jgi:hypothetical protein